MKKEIWKDIKDYEGLYMVSNWGRIKSIRFGKERILKPFTNNRGYLQVNLYKNNKGKRFYVHRLVAEAFLPNTDNLPCVNHKDENPQNNNVENLEFCTYEYNNTYGTRIEKCSKPILQYTLDGQLIREWDSIAECGRNGFSLGCVCMCCRGQQKTHKGFIWEYK